jgi:hypothetical protein
VSRSKRYFRSITGELCAAQRTADGELLGAHLIGREVTGLLPELTLRPRRIRLSTLPGGNFGSFQAERKRRGNFCLWSRQRGPCSGRQIYSPAGG